MTNEQIIEIAKECSLVAGNASNGIYLNALVSFAKAVAEHEREACALIADCWVKAYSHPSKIIAETIRLRG